MNFVQLANNSNGLGVVKKTIIHAKSVAMKESIRNALLENSRLLIQNPYGNYSIQVALDVSKHFKIRPGEKILLLLCLINLLDI